jgi:hypothetical protein
MRFASGISGLALALVVGASVVLSGCGGGGGGGGGTGGGDSVLLTITAQGVATPLWQNINGIPTTPPVCPDGVFVNSTITFTFGAAVTASSLPQGGTAIGSINIVVASTGQPALGSFTVVDEPGLPAGNQRRVLFSPTPPGNPNAQCSSGLFATQVYQISMPAGGASPQVVQVGGAPVLNSATTCFQTCGCPQPGTCVSSFTDPIPGAPYVVVTTPNTSNPAPTPVDPNTIANNTIQILVSEPLNPAGINLANVRVVNAATGAQVPGTLQFFQAGSIPGLTINSRIDYIASSPLLGSVTYQVLFTSQVQDFGGNPIQPVQGNPTAQLFFQTIAVPFCPQPPLDETFATVQNKDLISGEFQWDGTGFLQSTFPIILTGTGADGAFTPPVAQTTILDTAQVVSGQPRAGFWNFTSVNIPQTAIVRIVGPYQAHLRCQQTFTLLGTINCNAASGPATSANVYDRGPEQGIQNNNGGLNCEANGGVGNAGGGAGGTGSGVTPPAGSPPSFQCTVRENKGENGYGPTISGAPNNGTPPNLTYAGGTGGDSGCFPAAGAGCNVGDLGGLGGAGGTAGRKGEDGLPRVSTAQCGPVSPVVQPIGTASNVAPAMIPPISAPSAGSGGGGGGDHWESTGTPPNNDDQGGGAGGGGGGLRISCVGAFQMGGAAAGTITCRGAQGNTAQASGGGGGSGSGGELWIQSFSTVSITATSLVDVTGPIRLSPTVGAIGCSNQAAGGGGPGLVQIEAGVGPPPTVNFNLQPVPTATDGAIFSGPAFQYSGGVTGQATSKFLYTGYGAPDYTSAQETFTLGNAANATLTIRYEGAQEAVNSTAQNPTYDPTTIKSQATGGGPITAANISELDGYAFIRFVVNVGFPPPPTTAPNAILPSVDRIQIFYNAALNCP